MQYDWMIIDGYSLLHREPRLKQYLQGSLELGRDHLVRLVENAAFALADRVTMVFDGKSEKGGHDAKATRVEVVYSPGNQTADTVIERLVSTSENPKSICVVSNDRAELNVITGNGAEGMSCGQFLDLYEFSQRTSRPSQHAGNSKSTFSLGDLFPG